MIGVPTLGTRVELCWSWFLVSASTLKVGIQVTLLELRLTETDIGGMEMLQDLLKIEDVVVRKEAAAAIRGICTDEEGKTHAQSGNVSDVLLECLMVLILLDCCLPKDQCVVDKMCDKAVELSTVMEV